jgi:hypothetical protein
VQALAEEKKSNDVGTKGQGKEALGNYTARVCSTALAGK